MAVILGAGLLGPLGGGLLYGHGGHAGQAMAASGDTDDDDDAGASADISDTDSAGHKDPLRSLLRQASKSRQFSLPQESELQQAEQLFAQLLQTPDAASPKLQAAANALQMELQNVNGYTVLLEKTNAHRGRGLFAFRSANSGKTTDVLQVPHAFTDEMTREIGLGLFAEGRFAAVAFNTVPRRYNDEQGRQVVADMAHITGTYFLAFTHATAKVLPKGRTMQIHGFDQGKRKSAALSSTDMILSAGHGSPPSSLRQSRECMEKRLQRGVTLYADGVKELGATTNVQAAALRSLGYDNFIHVEMSRPLRTLMRDDAGARRQLLSCILQSGA